MLKSLEKPKLYGLNSRWQIELNALSKTEKTLFSTVIATIVLLIGFDLQSDFLTQQSIHLLIDFCIGVGAIIGLLQT